LSNPSNRVSSGTNSSTVAAVTVPAVTVPAVTVPGVVAPTFVADAAEAEGESVAGPLAAGLIAGSAEEGQDVVNDDVVPLPLVSSTASHESATDSAMLDLLPQLELRSASAESLAEVNDAEHIALIDATLSLLSTNRTA
jgi:hypothetical protein